MLVFVFFLRINLTINVAHPVFLMHTQSLLSGYTPAVYRHNLYFFVCIFLYLQPIENVSLKTVFYRNREQSMIYIEHVFKGNAFVYVLNGV